MNKSCQQSKTPVAVYMTKLMVCSLVFNLKHFLTSLIRIVCITPPNSKTNIYPETKEVLMVQSSELALGYSWFVVGCIKAILAVVYNRIYVVFVT
jgi:hypothetical protein